MTFFDQKSLAISFLSPKNTGYSFMLGEVVIYPIEIKDWSLSLVDFSSGISVNIIGMVDIDERTREPLVQPVKKSLYTRFLTKQELPTGVFWVNGFWWVLVNAEARESEIKELFSHLPKYKNSRFEINEIGFDACLKVDSAVERYYYLPAFKAVPEYCGNKLIKDFDASLLFSYKNNPLEKLYPCGYIGTLDVETGMLAIPKSETGMLIESIENKLPAGSYLCFNYMGILSYYFPKSTVDTAQGTLVNIKQETGDALYLLAKQFYLVYVMQTIDGVSRIQGVLFLDDNKNDLRFYVTDKKIFAQYFGDNEDAEVIQTVLSIWSVN